MQNAEGRIVNVEGTPEPALPTERSIRKLVIVVVFLVAVIAVAWFGVMNLIDGTLRVDVTVQDPLRRKVTNARVSIRQGERTVEANCSAEARCAARATVSLRSDPWQLEIVAPGYKPFTGAIDAPARYAGTVTLAPTGDVEDSRANLRPE